VNIGVGAEVGVALRGLNDRSLRRLGRCSDLIFDDMTVSGGGGKLIAALPADADCANIDTVDVMSVG